MLVDGYGTEAPCLDRAMPSSDEEMGLALIQTLARCTLYGRQQILNDPPVPSLDLGGDVHPRAQAHTPAVDQHVLLAQAQGGGVETAFFLVSHGVSGHQTDGGRHGAVAGVGKGFELDHRRLAGLHKADVQVGNADLRTQARTLGHHHHERLRRGDDTAHRVHGQLLHHAVHRGEQTGHALALAGLGPLSLQLPDFAAGLGQAVLQLAAGFGQKGSLGQLGLAGIGPGLGLAGALHLQVLLQLGAFTGFVLGGVA